jgi:hypothetical protein
VLLTAACLLRPGETYDSPRVRAEAGPWAMVALHALYEGVQRPEAAPAPIREVFAAYKEYADRRFVNNPRYYLELHDGQSPRRIYPDRIGRRAVRPRIQRQNNRALVNPS